jgi:hypothetical protein
MLNVQNRISKEAKMVTVRYPDGKVDRREIYPHKAEGIGDVSLRYVKYEPAFRHHKAIVDGYIGNAKVQLCSRQQSLCDV